MIKIRYSLLSRLRLVLLAGLASAAAAVPAPAAPQQAQQLLLITVMRTDDAAAARKHLESDAADGAIVRHWSSRSTRGPDHSLQVQVLEGETAFVHLGKTVQDVEILGVERRPVRRRLVPYVRPVNREYGEGFHVQAELSGNNVVLNLYHYSEVSRAESDMSSVNQAIRTTISGRIGQWLDAGGSLDLSPDHSEPSTAVRTYSVRHVDEDAARLLIKVERVDLRK